MTLKQDIIKAIERYAPPALQEKWDNTGLQLGILPGECTGVLICFDVTPAVVEEAVAKGCNLIVSHHPLFFKPIKRITGETPQQICAINAIAAGICVYSSHTAMDSTVGGVSYTLARRLGVKPERVLQTVEGDDDTVGLGIYGTTDAGLAPREFLQLVKRELGVPALRVSARGIDSATPVSRVAMCGGSGGEFISTAIAMGAQVYISGDVRYHDFTDLGDKIIIVDAGHYHTEQFVKETFRDIITRSFPDFKEVYCTDSNDNPIIII